MSDFTDQYMNQLLDFCGYALKRGYVMQEIKTLAKGRDIGSRAERHILDNEVTESEARRLFTKEDYLAHYQD